MTLTELDDRPELTVAIGGRDYRFSELPIGQIAALDEYLKRTVPHPVQAIRPHLAGLPPEDRQALLENARQQARSSWPPRADTAAGKAVLLSEEPGQLEAFAVGLSIHHPELSRDDCRKVFGALQRQAVRAAAAARKRGVADDGEGPIKRIFSVMFGFGDPDLADPDEAQPLPED